MNMLIQLISLAFDVYVLIIVLQVVVSWLIVFDVINTNNEKAQNLIALLKKATDPVYKPVQKFVPPIGGIDVTPIVVIFGLMILQSLITQLLIGLMY
ncbi:MAG: YggT family protein [Rhodospirillales bacterium]|nr:YggT family protein [Rhodospirillales bacterium]